jgi:GR25 family glycosyltransferase involved in LPS biosynthesis
MKIDKIFIINLKSRNDRLKNMKLLIENLNIDKNKIEVFEAVVGKELKDNEIINILSISSLDTLYNKSTNHKDIRTKGAIGCYLSHYKIWEKIINENLENVLIFEDDIVSDIDTAEFEDYVNSLPQDYDIGLLSWFSLWFDLLNNPKKNTVINNYWNKYSSINVFGCAAYMVSKKGAEKLVKNAFPICYQVDAYINILNDLEPSFIRYIANQSIFKQNNSKTDIQVDCNECDITEKINAMYNKRYNIETFNMVNNNNNLILLIFIIIITILVVKNK